MTTKTQEQYTNDILASEGLSYIPKNIYIQTQIQNVMDTFVGTKAQCDAKFEDTKNSAEVLYRELNKKSKTRETQLNNEWFDLQTHGMTENEKIFIQRLQYEFYLSFSEAVDKLDAFSDLLKL